MYHEPGIPPNVKEIEKAINALPKNELAQLREWFINFDADHWDKQFEEDAQSGKLDQLAAAALSDYKKGSFSEL